MKEILVDIQLLDLFKTPPTAREEILGKGIKRLKSTVPQGKILAGSYDSARRLHPEWANHVQGLNELVTNSRKRARKMNFEFSITLIDVVDLWLEQEGLCALTRIELAWQGGTLQDRNPLRASIDRIDSAQGYIRGNIRLACHWANNAKSTYSDELFRMMCEQTVLGFSTHSIHSKYPAASV
jgi:hypothetical protein